MKCGESFYIGIARYAKPVTKMVYNAMLLKLCIRIQRYIFSDTYTFYLFSFLFVENDSYVYIYRAYRSADMATSVKTEPQTDMMDM